MVTSVSDKEPQVKPGVSTPSSGTARLTVTGLDEKGQMYRESALILSLDGRDCCFRSKFQPALSSWVLVEFDWSKEGAKRNAIQGQVSSVLPEGAATNLYQVRVDLETVQEVKITATSAPQRNSSAEAKPVVAAPVAPPAAPPAKAQPFAEAKIAPPQPAAFQKPDQTGPIPPLTQNDAAKNSVPPSRPVPPPTPVAAPEIDRAALKSAIAAEIKEQLAALKTSLSKELDQAAQRTVSANMEQAVRQAVEKQIASNYQSLIETLNSDVTHQAVTRVSNSEELRNSIQGLAKKSLEEQIESSRNSAIEVQQNLISRVADFKQSVETSVADLENRLNVSRNSVTATTDRAQGQLDSLSRHFQTVLETLSGEAQQKMTLCVVELEARLNASREVVTAALDRVEAHGKEVEEAASRLQKSADQLNQSAQATIEKFDAHITAQLNSWSAQFKNHLESVSREKVEHYKGELQRALDSPAQQANEVLEKLAAGLQLAQGTTRMHEERLAKLSRDSVSNFETEIKAVLRRLSETV